IPGSLTIGDLFGGTGAVKGDVVQLLANSQITVTAAVTINNSGLLDLNGFSNTIGVAQTNALVLLGGSVSTGAGTLTLAGNVTHLATLASHIGATTSGDLSPGGAARTFDVQPGALGSQNPNAVNLTTNDLIISAVISNGVASAGLVKNNTGSLELLGNNTYTGPTAVNAGILLVDGSQPSSTITVNPGAALGGTGTTGPIVASSGRVNPGDPVNSIATLSGASADFSNNGNLTMQLATAYPVQTIAFGSGITDGTFALTFNGQ